MSKSLPCWSLSLPDVICFSHLRWDSVVQRPHHLMTRWARERRVFWIEEPCDGASAPTLEMRPSGVEDLHVVVPRVPDDLHGAAADQAIACAVAALAREEEIESHIRWYYTPRLLPYATQLPTPVATVYDCMDELTAFAGADPSLGHFEGCLFRAADVVFTGGRSLYEAKRSRHPRVHAFPSSVDIEHFRRARTWREEPADQRDIPRPRLGYFGVLDERLDLDLIRAVADLRPHWQLVFIGPTAKIDPRTLPCRPNVRYLGPRSYRDLPAYLAGWDVALLPFARNAATKHISPTKTPEYLAGGAPVVSTSIRDVVDPYGRRGLVRIADTATDFVAACEAAMAEARRARLARVDRFLAGRSWDRTWREMRAIVDDVAAPPRPLVASVDEAWLTT
ncbi:MAG TPA: glycosyltransferase [Candidatus Dormibacteraeota bacterium]|jgi:UDP-galactopyranose mutase|nr:glycosyltransferase [Candidatus Dormibacteraeota bacterium]